MVPVIRCSVVKVRKVINKLGFILTGKLHYGVHNETIGSPKVVVFGVLKEVLQGDFNIKIIEIGP